MVVIYSIGSISGAHINPAVSIAFWVAKRFETKEVLPYICFQLLGAFLASLSLKVMFPEHEFLAPLYLLIVGNNLCIRIYPNLYSDVCYSTTFSSSKEVGVMTDWLLVL